MVRALLPNEGWGYQNEGEKKVDDERAEGRIHFLFFNRIFYPLCISFTFVKALLCFLVLVQFCFWLVFTLKLMLSFLICHNLFFVSFLLLVLSFLNSFSSSLPR